MSISKLYNSIASISPYLEVAMRQLYWKNVDRLGKYNPHKATKRSDVKNAEKVDFDKVLSWFKEKGVGKRDLLIVHSGYGELERTGLTPEEIIDRLLELIGPQGTLAMPVIRRYKEVEKAKKEGKDWKKVVGKYNVKKTMVTSGMLPYTLMQRDDAIISHHPINPLCAVGPLAKDMMAHNLDGKAPSPHGPNSSWRFCYDHGAKVCAIGTDMEHHNTLSHVLEESFGNWYWPDDVWYDYLKYEITDEEKNIQEVVIRNRKEEWGKLHFAEINSCNEGKKSGVMISGEVEGITVGYIDSRKMHSKNKKGYPYVLLPWEDAKKVK